MHGRVVAGGADAVSGRGHVVPGELARSAVVAGIEPWALTLAGRARGAAETPGGWRTRTPAKVLSRSAVSRSYQVIMQRPERCVEHTRIASRALPTTAVGRARVPLSEALRLHFVVATGAGKTTRARCQVTRSFVTTTWARD